MYTPTIAGQVWAFLEFGGDIYAATLDLDAGFNFYASILRSATGNAGTWTEVYHVVGAAFAAAISLGEFGGNIYAGLTQPGKVIRSATGDLASWTEVLVGVNSIQAILEFDGNIYIGEHITGKIYRSPTGNLATWAEVYDSPTEADIWTMTVFNDTLYIGTGMSGQILKTTDGTTYTVVYESSETRINDLQVFGDGYMYVGTFTRGLILRVREIPTCHGAWLNTIVRGNNLGVDASADGYDMVPVNPTDIVAMSVGADFGGTNGHLKITEALWQPDLAGSIVAWIFRGVIGDDHVIFSSCDEASAVRRFVFRVTSGNLLEIYQEDNDVADQIRGSTTINADEWYRVVVTSTGTAYALYVNGQAETLAIISGANNGDWLGDTSARDNVMIAALEDLGGATEFFEGQIKDVRYFSRALI